MFQCFLDARLWKSVLWYGPSIHPVAFAARLRVHFSTFSFATWNMFGEYIGSFLFWLKFYPRWPPGGHFECKNRTITHVAHFFTINSITMIDMKLKLFTNK